MFCYSLLCSLFTDTISKNPFCFSLKIKGKVKVKFALKGHEGPEGEYVYSSTLSLTSALDGVSGQSQTPAALPPGMTRYALFRRMSGPRGRSGRVRKFSPPTGNEAPDRPVRSE